jgi:hypothetical protein
VDLGNVQLVGMSPDDVFGLSKLRIDDAGKKVWMLPQDVIDNTIKAFSVSATSPTGYSSLGAPTGRYFAPANGPNCIEVDEDADYGECGVRSLVVSGPMFQQHDLAVAKRINLVGRVNFEFRLEMLNAFNNVNFNPVWRHRQRHRRLRGHRTARHQHEPRHPAGDAHQLVTCHQAGRGDLGRPAPGRFPPPARSLPPW